MRALILFATDEGQTEKIARHISQRLTEQGIATDRHNIAVDPNRPIALDAYDAVIVGSPIHYSHYDVRLAEYLKQFRDLLHEMPSAFFSVSLGIMSEDDSEQDEVRKITAAYLHETDWNPLLTIHFAGALTYSKYNWLKRKLMQWVAKKEGGPTDTRFDYEFTNWKQVDLFVDQFVEFIQRCKQPDEEYAHRTMYSKPVRRYSVANLRAKAEESA
ncbi:Protoporphyrinogen IX dehydrogenase [menaquinone] [Stieleria neptunia]|uniref:Protoporphyrinogen IX dehydrogenase [menaquinone] n=1 Tax=Stieleria neptunia TaxID=2527979 RepID=A0A518HTZ7_9BACT|nr:flavodoxin domain-containing protein [Stieleria neptunia]QDV44322.1 Protoporphyrinogen IX dehydrogenase [menaquinone] [Stieleria neptunia]